MDSPRGGLCDGDQIEYLFYAVFTTRQRLLTDGRFIGQLNRLRAVPICAFRTYKVTCLDSYAAWLRTERLLGKVVKPVPIHPAVLLGKT